MISKLSLFLAILILAVFLAACNAADPPDPNLEGTNWFVVEISGDVLPEEIEITANFTDETIGGEAPCNVYAADYTQDGSQISIGDPIMTQIYCDEENVMETEDAYMQALDSVRQVELDEGNLLMKDDDDEVVLMLER